VFKKIYMGIDVGSVSTNIVVTDAFGQIIGQEYLRTKGRPIQAIQEGLRNIKNKLPGKAQITGVGTTGSGRLLAKAMVGADIAKNEITAHAVAAMKLVPGVKTVLEIGGQDSKIIIIRDGVVTDFAMNTVCAAGTGSFLDRQAERLGIPIEQFGNLAVNADNPTRIAGRCAVFAESDMIHKQQTGHSVENIIAGLCDALVRNYLNNVGKGKPIEPPIVFQGGVAANIGILKAFERHLGVKINVPSAHAIMGALGAALLAVEQIRKQNNTCFLGFELINSDFSTKGFDCKGCSNECEVIEILMNGKPVGRWGDRCGKWSDSLYVEHHEIGRKNNHLTPISAM
jgi:predicted CoA-substrate-specific enzyme activase